MQRMADLSRYSSPPSHRPKRSAVSPELRARYIAFLTRISSINRDFVAEASASFDYTPLCDFWFLTESYRRKIKETLHEFKDLANGDKAQLESYWRSAQEYKREVTKDNAVRSPFPSVAPEKRRRQAEDDDKDNVGPARQKVKYSHSPETPKAAGKESRLPEFVQSAPKTPTRGTKRAAALIESPSTAGRSFKTPMTSPGSIWKSQFPAAAPQAFETPQNKDTPVTKVPFKAGPFGVSAFAPIPPKGPSFNFSFGSQSNTASSAFQSFAPPVGLKSSNQTGSAAFGFLGAKGAGSSSGGFAFTGFKAAGKSGDDPTKLGEKRLTEAKTLLGSTSAKPFPETSPDTSPAGTLAPGAKESVFLNKTSESEQTATNRDKFDSSVEQDHESVVVEFEATMHLFPELQEKDTSKAREFGTGTFRLKLPKPGAPANIKPRISFCNATRSLVHANLLPGVIPKFNEALRSVYFVVIHPDPSGVAKKAPVDLKDNARKFGFEVREMGGIIVDGTRHSFAAMQQRVLQATPKRPGE